MSENAKTNINGLFKTTFETIKGTRTSGWTAEDSAQLAMPLIQAQTKPDGSPVQFTTEQVARINAALAITPTRILDVIRKEIGSAGGFLDEAASNLLAQVIDADKFRAKLVHKKILKAAEKGKKGGTDATDFLGAES